jgi:hypothetical protein
MISLLVVKAYYIPGILYYRLHQCAIPLIYYGIYITDPNREQKKPATGRRVVRVRPQPVDVGRSVFLRLHLLSGSDPQHQKCGG